ncbi:PIG-L family deacetylase [Nonomuraea sp. NPDC004580]|uniref:PIG-L family deacetylase n=1 Tax=Nonomuraea sp. NPDC004580 TaxID=3154552 RepID=UPI0033A2C739
MHAQRFTALSRRLTAVLGALAVLVPTAGAGYAATTTPEARFMQVVAHEDDDLLFMNPDVHDSIQAGMPSVTVFITAGQITGLGNSDAERARNRQRGAQDAYARMAAVPDADPQDQEEWEGDVWTLSGRQVERYTLKDAPHVQLVFMNLRDGQLGWFVWGDDFVDETIIPQGSQITQTFTYDTQDVIDVLSGMMQHYQPTVVRALDPMPEHRGHADHVGATMFARESAAAYGVPVIQLHYRDYNIRDVPVNLTPSAITQKLSILGDYFTYDPFDPDGWESRLYYRWARGTTWAARDSSGLPHVFVVRSGLVYAYAQDALGQWTGPVALADAGGPLAQGISVGHNADGRMQIFARRMSDDRVVSLRQTTPGGGWATTWVNHGNPGTGDPIHMGTPVVASNHNGRLQIFVRNGAGGVSTRAQTAANGTTWSSWSNLAGSDVQDGLAVATDPQGRIELFASTTTRILRWYQANSGFLLDNTLPSLVPASPPMAAVSQDGRIEVAYRKAGTAELVVTKQSSAGGPWNVGPVVIGGHAGVGEPALVTTSPGPDARILMFHRNADAGVSMAVQQTPNGGYGSWSDLGGFITDYPAATLDQSGAVLLFTVGVDGKLHLRKQTAPGADSPFGDWETLT